MKHIWLETTLIDSGIPESLATYLTYCIFFIAVVIIAATLHFTVRKTILTLVNRWAKSNRYQWDDILVNNHFFSRLSWFVPLAVCGIANDMLFDHASSPYLLIQRLVLTCVVIVGVLSANALFTSLRQIDQVVRKSKRSLLQGYTDAASIIAYIFGTIFIISILTGKSPWGILSVLGGLTAVTMLVFKDTILGFVASLQLNATDMVQIGDWIEMPQYNADGDVISISIHCVKVQNWDKTITTIPTYALVSSSFRNWRGMTDSGGRRIKRALLIDMNSIRFCSEELLTKLSEVTLLQDYLESKNREIEEYNSQLPRPENPLNQRRQTNIGIFRAYVIAYLKHNSNIRDDMTFLVRQLAPEDRGLPMEIYVFSKDQRWAYYESIQADIFDHLLAALPEFELRIFQNPSGNDLLAAARTIINQCHSNSTLAITEKSTE